MNTFLENTIFVSGKQSNVYILEDPLISSQLERSPWEIYLYEKNVDSASQEIMPMDALFTLEFPRVYFVLEIDTEIHEHTHSYEKIFSSSFLRNLMKKVSRVKL